MIFAHKNCHHIQPREQYETTPGKNILCLVMHMHFAAIYQNQFNKIVSKYIRDKHTFVNKKDTQITTKLRTSPQAQ